MSESRPSVLARVIVFLIVTGAVLAGGWWFLQHKHGQEAGGDAKGPAAARGGAALVHVAKVGRENYATDLEAVGTVRAFESTDLSPNVTETITELHFDDGQQVKKGDVLAKLSDAEEQALLESARSLLAEQEREIARIKDLVKEGAVPEARLQERETLADVAQHRIREAEAKLADRRIVAPFDGWVGLRRISVGALVSPGAVIATLDKIDVVKIDFNLPETVLGTVRPGTEITTTSEGASEKELKGKVSQIDSRVDEVTRSVAARAEVKNPDLTLKPGMLVTVRVSMEPRLSVSVPERALVPVGSRQYVFLLAGGGESAKAKRIEIKIGRRKPGYAEVLEGLKEGQTVITDGLVGLQDGAPVKVGGEFKEPSPAFNPEVREDSQP